MIAWHNARAYHEEIIVRSDVSDFLSDGSIEIRESGC